jgi:DNA-binding response OmpR family regulator
MVQAFDGEKGLKDAEEQKPNLILLDIMMPKMNGLEVLKNLKENSETKNIPVFILTVLGADEDIRKGLELGAKDYIVKSQHAVSEIVEKIDKFMETAL